MSKFLPKASLNTEFNKIQRSNENKTALSTHKSLKFGGIMLAFSNQSISDSSKKRTQAMPVKKKKKRIRKKMRKENSLLLSK